MMIFIYLMLILDNLRNKENKIVFGFARRFRYFQHTAVFVNLNLVWSRLLFVLCSDYSLVLIGTKTHSLQCIRTHIEYQHCELKVYKLR